MREQVAERSSRAGRPGRRARRSPPRPRRAPRPRSRASSPTPSEAARSTLAVRELARRRGTPQRRRRCRTASRRLAEAPPRHRHYPAMDRQLISSGAAFEERVGYSRAVRVGQLGLGLGDGADHAGRRRPARRRLRAGADLPRDHRRARSPRPARALDDVVRTRIYVTDAALHRRGRPGAPRGVRGRAARRRPASSPSCSTRAGSSRSRPRP